MTLVSGYLSKTRNTRIIPYVRGDLLDIGCGRGELLKRVLNQIGRYTGVDIDAGRIEAARREHPGAEFHVIDIDKKPLMFSNEFDTIVLVAVIEHIFNLGMLGQGLERALRPGGRVILTTPTPLGNDVVHRLGARVGLFSKVAADDHIAIFNRKRFEIFSSECGLTLAEHHLFQFGCNQLAVLEKPA